MQANWFLTRKLWVVKNKFWKLILVRMIQKRKNRFLHETFILWFTTQRMNWRKRENQLIKEFINLSKKILILILRKIQLMRRKNRYHSLRTIKRMILWLLLKRRHLKVNQNIERKIINWNFKILDSITISIKLLI